MQVAPRRPPRVAAVGVRVVIAASVVLAAIAGVYLTDADTRRAMSESFAPDAGFPGVPGGLRWSLGLFAMLNLPVAFATQFFVMLLNYSAPGLSAVARNTMVLIVAAGSCALWWGFLLKKTRGAS